MAGTQERSEIAFGTTKRRGLQPWLLAVVFTALFAVIGCEGAGKIKTLDEVEDPAHISYGRVKVISSETPDTSVDDCGFMQHMVCPDEFRLIILPPGIRSVITHRLNGDGTFYWSLPPGRYTVVRYSWHRWGGDTWGSSGYVGGEFSVPTEPGATYLGTLNIHVYKKGSYGYYADSEGAYALTMGDDYEEATRKLEAKLGQSLPSTHRSLITLEERQEPSGPDICSGEWGIFCTRYFSGVTPTLPEITLERRYGSFLEPSRFPMVGSLTPKLQWVSSQDQEVSYDLIVHRAIPYSTIRTDLKPGVGAHVRGPLVTYASDLREPRYQLTTPLAPGAAYYWSVRLRRGSVVSPWSTVQGPHSKGSPFSFLTPPQ